MLFKVKSETITIRIGNNTIKPSNTVRNLGVVYEFEFVLRIYPNL